MNKTRKISRFLDPELIAALSSMEIRARNVVEGMIEGLHKSPFKGFNVEFNEYRQYVPGDPIKDIDWKVYAKTDKYYIKEHEEETNLSGYIVIDTSGSMSYKGSSKMNKLEYSSTLAASLAYLMIKQHDSVGLVTFAEGLRKIISPRSGMPHLKCICDELERTEPGQITRIPQSLDMVGQAMKKRGICIIFSDLMDDTELIIKKLRQLRARRHEVVLYHVLDPDEIRFPFDDTTSFHDLEDGSSLITDAFNVKKEYLKRLRNLVNTFRTALRKSGVDYLLADTSMPLDVNLKSFFTRRQAQILKQE